MWTLFDLFRSKPLTVQPNEARIYQMPARPCTAPTAQGAVRRMKDAEVLPIHPNNQR